MTESNYIHSLKMLQFLDRVNRSLASAVSIREAFTPTERAWFRSPIKGDK